MAGAIDVEVLRVVILPAMCAFEPVCVAACIKCSRPAMKKLVVRLIWADNKVARPVVRPVFIDVMYLDASRKLPAKRTLRDMTVLKHVAGTRKNGHIPIAVPSHGYRTDIDVRSQLHLINLGYRVFATALERGMEADFLDGLFLAVGHDADFLYFASGLGDSQRLQCGFKDHGDTFRVEVGKNCGNWRRASRLASSSFEAVT